MKLKKYREQKRVVVKNQPARKPTGLKKRSEVDALGLEPRTVRLLAKSAYASLASHAFGIELDAYHIEKKEPVGRKRQLVLEKRSEVDALGLEPRTVRL